MLTQRAPNWLTNFKERTNEGANDDKNKFMSLDENKKICDLGILAESRKGKLTGWRLH